jgi:type VI secretion system protein ImpA
MMASQQTIDIAAILNPIPGDSPAGVDVRYAGPHDVIKEARRADDDLAKGGWEKKEVKTADWSAVIKVATSVLISQSKDLQVAVWLTEALLQRYGFAGLRDGLKIVRGFHERYRDAMYPLVTDGDVDYRTSPLNWMDKTFPVPIKAVPLIRSAKGEPYAYMHWEKSREIDNAARKNSAAYAQGLPEGTITGEQFDKAAAATPSAHYAVLFEDLNDCWHGIDALSKLADEQYGKEASSFLQLRQAIEDCRGLIEAQMKKKGAVPQTKQPAASAEPEAREVTMRSTAVQPIAVPMAVASASNGGIDPSDRADALRRLEAVAQFFKRTEPHSPVAYLIQRAVRWGEMPFENWLVEVISDQSVLTRIRETLGISQAGASAPSADE